MPNEPIFEHPPSTSDPGVADDTAMHGAARYTPRSPCEDAARPGDANEATSPRKTGEVSHEPLECGNHQPKVVDESEPEYDSYDPANKWWAMSVAQTCKLVKLEDISVGIPVEEVPRHAEELGDNIIPISGGTNIVWLFCRQFLNGITLILTIIVVISAVFQDWAEFGVVVFILFFNAILGFYQEYGAEKSLQSLKDMTAGSAKVLRGGVLMVVFVDEVVVGDVLILDQGTSVAADCRIIEASNLEVDEALLTGEALPVLKHIHIIPDPDDRCALGDRKNMVYRNTLVTQGRGRAVVVAGGTFTEMGKLAKRLDSGSSESKTELIKKLDYMMYFLFFCCMVLACIVFAVEKFKYSPTTLSYATAVAIAILPESLVVVVTVAMTVSVRRMAKQRCIVRKLAVLEVLGNVTDICSDKTGTLTENKMVVKKTLIGTNETFSVTGTPHGVLGHFMESDVPADEDDEPYIISAHFAENKHHYDFFRCAAMCGSTVMHISSEDPESLSGTGNPTEIAIQVMTWKARLHRGRLEEDGWSCLGEYPFDSKIKRMSAVWFNETTEELYLCTKGAPERILDLCQYRLSPDGQVQPLTAEDRHTIDTHISDLASQGLRTICFSQRYMRDVNFTLPEDETFVNTFDREIVEQDLIYLGLVGIYDPPRPESLPSVIACQHAGIVVRMLTGDHTSTAGSIAVMLNIIGSRDVDNPIKLLAGPDFDRVDPDVIDGWNDLPLVVGRCSPESKVKMIESLHRRKRVVAMTGDGFNDSPSIKIADIGCAMGSGTDVTKGVADLVITDDNFSTIVKAVAEGRRVSQCIAKFVVHLLSSNVAEVIALICGLPIRHEGASLFVLSPIQILWLNLVTSGPPATGLSLDEATADILLVPPNRKGLFSLELIADTFTYGFVLGSLALLSFVFVLYGIYDGPVGMDCNRHRGVGCDHVWRARSTSFGVLYFGLLLHAYNVRHPRLSVFKMKWFDNKWLYGAVGLGTILFVPIIYIPQIATNLFVHTMITWEWGVLGVCMIVFMTCAELYKLFKNWLFPIKRTSVSPQEEEAQTQEYLQFTRAAHDNRDVASIAEENMRMSFASYADSIGTTGAGRANPGKKRRR